VQAASAAEEPGSKTGAQPPWVLDPRVCATLPSPVNQGNMACCWQHRPEAGTGVECVHQGQSPHTRRAAVCGLQRSETAWRAAASRTWGQASWVQDHTTCQCQQHKPLLAVFCANLLVGATPAAARAVPTGRICVPCPPCTTLWAEYLRACAEEGEAGDSN
jgi:hypothetical protein